MNEFVTKRFKVEFHEDGINFDCLDYIVYHSDKFGWIRTKTSSDGLSVPTVFINIIQKYGKYLKAGIIHDGAFKGLLERMTVDGWIQWLPTEHEANQLIDEALQCLGCPWIERKTIYNALELFGWTAFREDRIKIEYIESTPLEQTVINITDMPMSNTIS